MRRPCASSLAPRLVLASSRWSSPSCSPTRTESQSATSASDSSEFALALAEALPTYCPTDELADLVSSTRQHIISRRQEQTTSMTWDVVCPAQYCCTELSRYIRIGARHRPRSKEDEKRLKDMAGDASSCSCNSLGASAAGTLEI